jgi:hypothetical protein
MNDIKRQREILPYKIRYGNCIMDPCKWYSQCTNDNKLQFISFGNRGYFDDTDTKIKLIQPIYGFGDRHNTGVEPKYIAGGIYRTDYIKNHCVKPLRIQARM